MEGMGTVRSGPAQEVQAGGAEGNPEEKQAAEVERRNGGDRGRNVRGTGSRRRRRAGGVVGEGDDDVEGTGVGVGVGAGNRERAAAARYRAGGRVAVAPIDGG